MMAQFQTNYTAIFVSATMAQNAITRPPVKDGSGQLGSAPLRAAPALLKEPAKANTL
ncbi:hypothetical protein [Erythrobacter sp. Alg231-14]|uniref:hypothetical protein n=1 Tax=Erythrobacter sp. Alg231-14 TaxID=1922225 RepID=UPI00307B18EE